MTVACFALFIAAVTAVCFLFYAMDLQRARGRGELYFQKHQNEIDHLWNYQKILGERTDLLYEGHTRLSELHASCERKLDTHWNLIGTVYDCALTAARRRPTVLFQRQEWGQGLPLPSYQTPGAAGMDLCAAYCVIIPPGGLRLVGTGFRLKIEDGYEGQVRSRSGLARNHQVVVLNQPGTIDSDYTGEILVMLKNLGEEYYTVNHGDRIAQLIVTPVKQAFVIEIDELPQTVRGEGGFGSTGRSATCHLVETVVVPSLPAGSIEMVEEEDFTNEGQLEIPFEVTPPVLSEVGCEGFSWLGDNVKRERLGLPPVPVD